MGVYIYECKAGHVTEITLGINEERPKSCDFLLPRILGVATSVRRECGEELEYTFPPVYFDVDSLKGWRK